MNMLYNVYLQQDTPYRQNDSAWMTFQYWETMISMFESSPSETGIVKTILQNTEVFMRDRRKCIVTILTKNVSFLTL